MSAGDSMPVLSLDVALEASADVLSLQQVAWRGVEWHQVLAFAIMWEAHSRVLAAFDCNPTYRLQ